MAAALAQVTELRADDPTRARVIYEAIALAGRSRRSHREALRLYDPAAFRLFYTADGQADQRRIAVALEWDRWPRALPEALVHAAPLPALTWLSAQSKAKSPQLERLREVWRYWGWWIRSHHERQYREPVRDLVSEFARNPALTGDPTTCAALVRLAGEVRAADARDWVAKQTRSAAAEVRAEACAALGRLGGPSAAAAVIALAADESEVNVLTKVGAAARAWPDNPAMGQAMLELFGRVTDSAVQREIVYSAAESEWSQRDPLIHQGLESPDPGVVGVALQAVAGRPSQELAERVFARLDSARDVQPQLVDAVGALSEPRAAPKLVRWLQTERNLAIQIKLALALEKIGGETADQALGQLLAQADHPLLAQQVAGIAGRRELAGTEPMLIALAEDRTAPMPARIPAIWALGRYDRPAVRASLRRMEREPGEYFGDAADERLTAEQYDQIEQAGLFVALAQMRLGEEGADADAGRRYAQGPATIKYLMLGALAEMKRDHPVITEGLASGDFAVLLAAIHAAGRVDPVKYRGPLVQLHDAPFLAALAESGLDTAGFAERLAAAIRGGQSP